MMQLVGEHLYSMVIDTMPVFLIFCNIVLAFGIGHCHWAVGL